VLDWQSSPRLVALDVDGTLLRTDGTLADETVAAVHEVRSSGIEVVLTTSRGVAALLPVTERLGLGEDHVFIAAQGALTGSCPGPGRLRVEDHHPVPLAAGRQVVETVVAAGFSVSWYAGEDWFVNRVDATIEEEVREVGVTPEVRDLVALPRAPDKLMVISEPERTDELDHLAEQLPRGVAAQVSNPQFLEITRSDVDKASGLERYCSRRGIVLADVVAVGDGPNDLGMFARVGASIAPANARPAVLAAATVVTRSNDDGGVAEALRAMAAGSTRDSTIPA
jgi:Cof subfamily protein (haloacid dehalogenase superfamily)